MLEVLLGAGVVGGVTGILAVILVLSERYIANYGECHVDINGDEDLGFTVNGGGNLLLTLADRKVFIPSACGGQGTCGYCKIQVEEGGGELLPTEKPYLTRAEIRQRVRLACRVKIKSDVKLRIPEELLAVQEYQTVVEKIESLTYDTKLIRLRLREPSETSFKPGQYYQIRVPDAYLQRLRPPIFDPVFRAYSTAWIPRDKHFLEFIVRLIPDGICTTWVFKNLKEGDPVTITGPYGEFLLRDGDRDIICVAGGSGVAPIRAILEHLFANGTNRRIHYYFGARAVKDLYYHDTNVERAARHDNFTFVPALSARDRGDRWDGETGFIHTVIDKRFADMSQMEAYLCGPPVMVEAVKETLKKHGLPQERIYFDAF